MVILSIFLLREELQQVLTGEITSKQLKEWGFKVSFIKTCKPEADLYIDDKATNAEDF